MTVTTCCGVCRRRECGSQETFENSVPSTNPSDETHGLCQPMAKCYHRVPRTGGSPMTPRFSLRRQPRANDLDESESGMMGFLDHLEELRKRLIRSCIAIA